MLIAVLRLLAGSVLDIAGGSSVTYSLSVLDHVCFGFGGVPLLTLLPVIWCYIQWLSEDR